VDSESSLRPCDQFTRLIGLDGTLVDEDDVDPTSLVCDRPRADHPDSGTRALPTERIHELRERAITVAIAETIATSEKF
jgi:hypothetical protein